MALTLLQVNDVCRGQAGKDYTQYNICKYLSYETVGSRSVPLCIKKAPALIDKKKKNSFNWNQGKDNCPGYPYMKHIPQGYDV